MNSTITVIYENGILRPLTPMMVPERARLQIRVEHVEAPTDTTEHRRQVHKALVTTGLSLPTPSLPTPSESISADRRDELARVFAAGQPLSEIIIEERDGR